MLISFTKVRGDETAIHELVKAPVRVLNAPVKIRSTSQSGQADADLIRTSFGRALLMNQFSGSSTTEPDYVSSCTSCGDETEWICERDDKPLCKHCECVWVMQHSVGWRHIPKGSGTPYMRFYMNLWPRHLPPPKTKERARAAVDIEAFVEHMLDAVCESLLPAWDREDALLAVAEVAVRVHARDARVIDAWNKFVKSENSKRHFRRMQGWRNNYYTRIIGDDDRPRNDRQPE